MWSRAESCSLMQNWDLNLDQSDLITRALPNSAAFHGIRIRLPKKIAESPYLESSFHYNNE